MQYALRTILKFDFLPTFRYHDSEHERVNLSFVSFHTGGRD
jgi:hypothetical protein